MEWLFPQKPVRVDESIFDRIDLNDYRQEEKLDGWRVTLTVDNGIKLYTRLKNFIQIPNNLKSLLNELNLPNGTILDGEIWNKTKRGSWSHDQNSICYMSFWDVVRYENVSYIDTQIELRKNKLVELVKESEFINIVKSDKANKDDFVKIKNEAFKHKNATGCKSGYVHGVVLKKNGSPRRDHALRSFEHVDWLKVVFF